ncbi:MAG: hypothetical protein R3D05_08710 [Dongiaceae bacterium]
MFKFEEEEFVDRGLKLAGIALVLCAGFALASCSSSGGGVANEIASCTGGYPDGGGVTNMSPYSPNANPYQPDCQGRG